MLKSIIISQKRNHIWHSFFDSFLVFNKMARRVFSLLLISVTTSKNFRNPSNSFLFFIVFLLSLFLSCDWVLNIHNVIKIKHICISIAITYVYSNIGSIYSNKEAVIKKITSLSICNMYDSGNPPSIWIQDVAQPCVSHLLVLLVSKWRKVGLWARKELWSSGMFTGTHINMI